MKARELVAAAFVASVCVACSSDPERAADMSTPDSGTPAAPDGAATPIVDAGSDAAPSGPNPAYNGQPIDAEAGKWSWVSFPDSSCMNGDPAGLGINPGTSDTLLFYLEGGGACWDEQSCFTAPKAARTTAGVTEKDIAPLNTSDADWPFNRAQEANPFKDASMVYVPYCTGDLHAGAREQTYGKKTAKHFGRKNIEAFLQRIVPTFKNVKRVVLSGSSAGGLGTHLNFHRVQGAFGTIRVDFIDDAGHPLPAKDVKLLSTWSDSWDLAGGFPADCADCTQGFDRLLPYYFSKYPSSRFALLSFETDNTIPGYYGITPAIFKTELAALLAANFDPTPNAKDFVLAGKGHGTLDDLGRNVGNTTLGTWLGAMQTDTPAWASVKP